MKDETSPHSSTDPEPLTKGQLLMRELWRKRPDKARAVPAILEQRRRERSKEAEPGEERES